MTDRRTDRSRGAGNRVPGAGRAHLASVEARQRAEQARRRRRRILRAVWAAAAVLVQWALMASGVIARHPLALLLPVEALLVGFAALGARCYAIRPAPPTAHIRMATQAVAVTVVIYLTGWGPALALGYCFAILNNAFHVGSRSRLALLLWPVATLGGAQAVASATGAQLRIGLSTADGLAAVAGVALLLVALFVTRLVAEKEAAERQLAHAASHDTLTGLMNRSAFCRQLGGRLSGTSEAGRGRSRRPPARHDRRGTPRPRRHPAVAVLFGDLVGFKEVNDRFGHEAGDAVLTEVARRLAGSVRDGDLLARFAGDEFVVGLCPLASAGCAVAAAERLLAVFDQPFLVGRVPLQIGISVGIVYSATGRVDVERLLAEADAAMYEAKAQRRSAWALLEVA